ncbi:MAG: protein-export chaperone SecB [Mangrovibacterium sp.]
MSQEESVAAFQFNRFLVNESHFSFATEGREYNLSVSISPSGIAFTELHQFHLSLEVVVKDKEDKFECSIRTTSVFSFPEDTDLEQYKSSFFITNAPAITFPYIRAYIATLTAQSGVFNILLPTLNLSGLAEDLKGKIVIQ